MYSNYKKSINNQDWSKFQPDLQDYDEWHIYQQTDDYKNRSPSTRPITQKELAEHQQNPNDLWIALSYKGAVAVFDLSKFALYHPGGHDDLWNAAGKNSTKEFREAHSYISCDLIANFQIGVLVEDATTPTNQSAGQPESTTASNQAEIEETLKFAENISGFEEWRNNLSSAEYRNLVPGNRIISSSELAKHTSEDDMWIALEFQKKICVFDVTKFAAAHPGGEDELLCVAGTNATEEFRSAHSYVSADLIANYRVGFLEELPASNEAIEFPLLFSTPPLSDAGHSEADKNALTWCLNANELVVKLPAERNPPSSSSPLSRVQCVWLERDHLKLRILLRPANDDVTCLPPPFYQFLEIELPKNASPNLDSLSIAENTLTLKLDQLDAAIISANQLIQKRNYPVKLVDLVEEEEYFEFQLHTFQDISPNIRRFVFRAPPYTRISAPTCHHVNIKVQISSTNQSKTVGEEEFRPYTPICDWSELLAPVSTSRNDKNEADGHIKGRDLEFAIKKYEKGKVSSALHSLKIGDSALISLPYGAADIAWRNRAGSEATAAGSLGGSMADSVEHLALIAAGTGITPMISLLASLIPTQISATLLFFVRHRSDRIWRREFSQLKRKLENRFRYRFIISQPEKDAQSAEQVVEKEEEGEQPEDLTGRINEALLKQELLARWDAAELQRAQSVGAAASEGEASGEGGGEERSLNLAGTRLARSALYVLCGPNPFTAAGVKIIKKWNVPTELIWPMKG